MSKTDKPKITWWTDSDWLYVRLENISNNKTVFDGILHQFKGKMSYTAKWEPILKAWKLPKPDMQKIALFAYEFFGDDSLYPHDMNNKPFQPQLL